MPTPFPRLVLASRSPQRRALLAQLGINFTVREVDVEELSTGEPGEVARENARRKAQAGVDAAPGAAVAAELVLGVDTLVALEGEIYGKPGGEDHARRTLTHLSGRRHEVFSGLATVLEDACEVEVVRTSVTMRRLSPDTLEWYLATQEWRGRAGGYAIQGAGAALIEAIEGDYTNVVGLPLARLLARHPQILS